MYRKPKNAKKQDDSHARLAPSAFKGYEVCPSYVPDDEVTKAGERGTRLHKKLEEHGHKVDAEAEPEEIDAYQLKMVADYIRPFEEAAAIEKFKILREHRFNLLPLGVDGCDRGTGDLLILSKVAKHIELFDYKFGWIEVDDAEFNIQIGIYVLGCFFTYPWADTVMARILQPARDEISTHLFHREDINPILLRARTIADRTNAQADKVFNPTVDVCLWCANKANCLALHAMTLQAKDQARIQLPQGVDLDPRKFNTVAASGDVYDFAAIIEKWASAIKWQIICMAHDDGIEIPDHELREVSGKRAIIDPEGAQEILQNQFGVPLSDFLAASNPSISKMEKLVGDRAEHGVKGDAKEAMSNALMAEGIVAKGNPSRFLVRIKTKAGK